MNSFGKNLRLTTFGESHGPAMGGILDGFPPGVRIDFETVSRMTARRRPGSSSLVSSRREDDNPEFLSGISPDGKSLGTPIAFIVRNKDQRSRDYDELRLLCRPNHADLTTQARFGIRDWRGGGRASARETVSWVIAGAIASGWLSSQGVTVESRLERIGGVPATEQNVASLTEEARRTGDSIGGIVSCRISGVPLGRAGNPVFGKLQAALAQAMLTINGVHGFEYGDGFAMAAAKGSEVADQYPERAEKIPLPDGTCATVPSTNHSGGIQGGISNGHEIFFRVAFKPTPTIGRELRCWNLEGRSVPHKAAGRHDPCIAIRGAVVVEAMAALVLADELLSPIYRSHESSLS